MIIRLITIFSFFILIACNQVEKVNILSLSDLAKKELINNLDSLPEDLSQVYRLDLSEKSLVRIPEVVYKMINLQELNLSNNQILNIDSIYLIDNLQILKIGNNRISSLPDKIDYLKHLKLFDLYWNDIITLPNSFFSLDSIEELDMTSMFKFDFATNLTKFHRLKQLQKLNLGNNQIPSLTLRFEGLKNLVEFGFIRQDSIDCKALIARLDSCPNLKIIHLSVNNIKNLPKNIVLLDSLERLNLYENKLTELPIEICEMKNLKEITLIDNPINTNKIRIIESKMINTKIIY